MMQIPRRWAGYCVIGACGWLLSAAGGYADASPAAAEPAGRREAVILETLQRLQHNGAVDRQEAVEQALQEIAPAETGALQAGQAVPPRSAFQTFVVEKTTEAMAQEAPVQASVQAAAPPPPQLRKTPDVPYSARPSVKLGGQINYSYGTSQPASKPTRGVSTFIGGQVLDAAVKFETRRRDIRGRFDHDTTWATIHKDTFSAKLFNQSATLDLLRSQTKEFDGVSVTQQYRGGATTLRAGELSNNISSSAGSVKYVGRLYNLEQDLKVSKALQVKSGMYYLTNETELASLSGATNFPRSNILPYSVVRLALPRGLSISSAMARSNYRPDDATDDLVGDWDWRTDVDWETERYGMSFGYEFIGDRYVSFDDPDSYNDFSGWEWSGRVRVTPRWSVSGDAKYYADNVRDNPNSSTNAVEAFGLTTSYQLTKSQFITLGVTDSLSNPSGGSSTISSQRSRYYSLGLFSPFLWKTTFSSNYQLSTANARTATGSKTHTVNAFLTKPYDGGSWSVSQQLSKSLPDARENQLSLSTSFSLYHRLTRLMELQMNSIYARTERQNLGDGDNSLSGSLGVAYKLRPTTDVRMTYNVTSYDLDAQHWKWPRSWSLLFGVNQGFAVSSPPVFGKITGKVFEDLNANGRQDRGEPAMARASVLLVDYPPATSDANGRFKFSRVAPGKQFIQLDLASLDVDWSVVQLAREITVRRHGVTVADFPVVKAADVSGRVFVDDNGDGAFQKREEPLAEIPVILLPTDTKQPPKEIFRRTDASGEYVFNGLLPGSYALRIHADAIPRGYEMASEGSVDLTLAPGDEATERDFVIRLIPVPVTQF